MTIKLYVYIFSPLLLQMWMSAQVSIIANNNVKTFRVPTIAAVMRDLNLVQMERAAMVCVYSMLSTSKTKLFIFLSVVLSECSESNNCSHICAIINEMPTCFCNAGYKLAEGSSAQCVGTF